MKKILKIFAILLVVLIVLVAGGALYISASGIPTYDAPTLTLTVERTPARLVRGRQLVSLLCMDCHLNQKTKALTGQRMIDVPPEFGVIFSSNITQDPDKGIGGWTDGQLVYFLRTGILKDGRFVPPVMPKFPNLADEDLFSIITFLRSDDPRLAPMAVVDSACDYSLLTKFLSHVAFKPFPYPTAPIPMPDTSNHVVFGKYLVANSGCFACHSADFTKLDELHPERSEGFMGGGNTLIDINGEEVYTPNLTPDMETGIGSWTESQFVAAVKEGFRSDGTLVRAPMPLWRDFTDQEVAAMYAYLRTVPVIKKPWIKRSAPTTFSSDGERFYKQYGCNSCHGNTGKGYVTFDAVGTKFPTDSLLEIKIRNPFAFEPESRMPLWQGMIREQDYRPLTAHIRTLSRQH